MHFSLTSQTITGTVLDENKQPMIGAAARLQGTTAGTTTNMDGKFSLKSSKIGKVILEFSFVG
jgi:hypothetical protein